MLFYVFYFVVTAKQVSNGMGTQLYSYHQHIFAQNIIIIIFYFKETMYPSPKYLLFTVLI